MVILTKTSPTLKLGKVTTDEHVDVFQGLTTVVGA